MKMNYALLVLFVSLLLMNCSARPIQSSSITDIRFEPVAPSIAERSVMDSESHIDFGELKDLNKKAGRPTIAIIKGFYQLPEAFPFGAISYERERTFGFDYRSVKISKLSSRPYVVTPASAREVESISLSMNRLMDAGIRFKELSLADATRVIKAEKAALSKKQIIFPRTSVMSGVDLLLSVEKGTGEFGNIFVGRVIGTKDGQLYALDTQLDAGPFSLGPFLSRLVKVGLQRMGAAL